MDTDKSTVLRVQNIPIAITSLNHEDYICITDLANAKNSESRAADIIKNWIRTRNTLEFLGTWEMLYNGERFKVVEFDHFKMEAGLPTFVLSVKQWIEKTDAKGLYVKNGKYGGTYAHKDIAFEFCSAISPVFKLYLIKEYQQLRTSENERLRLEWDYRRFLSKVNYKIHTDAIQDHLMPPELTERQKNMIYAQEADMLNVAMFGMTAKEWREQHPDEKGNIRDQATLDQLLVVSNMESLNAELIRRGMPQPERLVFLNQTAINQMRSLLAHPTTKRLK